MLSVSYVGRRVSLIWFDVRGRRCRRNDGRSKWELLSGRGTGERKTYLLPVRRDKSAPSKYPRDSEAGLCVPEPDNNKGGRLLDRSEMFTQEQGRGREGAREGRREEGDKRGCATRRTGRLTVNVHGRMDGWTGCVDGWVDGSMRWRLSVACAGLEWRGERDRDENECRKMKVSPLCVLSAHLDGQR